MNIRTERDWGNIWEGGGAGYNYIVPFNIFNQDGKVHVIPFRTIYSTVGGEHVTCTFSTTNRYTTCIDNNSSLNFHSFTNILHINITLNLILFHLLLLFQIIRVISTCTRIWLCTVSLNFDMWPFSPVSWCCFRPRWPVHVVAGWSLSIPLVSSTPAEVVDPPSHRYKMEREQHVTIHARVSTASILKVHW